MFRINKARIDALSPQNNRFKCEKNSLDGQPCNATFSRAGGLKRHDLDSHIYRSTTFVNCNPGANQAKTIHPFPVSTSSTTTSQPGPNHTPSAASAAPVPLEASLRVLPPSTSATSANHETVSRSMEPPAWTTRRGGVVFRNPFRPGQDLSASDHVEVQSIGRSDSRHIDGPSRYRPNSPVPPLSKRQSLQSSLEAIRSVTIMKRKWSGAVGGRCFEALRKLSIPKYEVKRSKKKNNQRGAEWIGETAKNDFATYYESLLAPWGVKPGHQGTCVLCPEDWRFSDPLDLMALFSKDNCPTLETSRAWYSYSDHGTSLARARAWFNKWPRSGIEHDNFIGSGPFKPMDASHLCHHGLCILHLVYEGADTNQDREDCRKEARRLRQAGEQVPEKCTKHDPPCMMQVSPTLLISMELTLL